MKFNKKIENLINKYKPNKSRCRANVNPNIYFENWEEFDILCLVTGYKQIYFTTNRKILQDIDQELKSFLKEIEIKKIQYQKYKLSKAIKKNNQIIMTPDFQKEERIILYSHEGEYNAHLLYKWEMEQNLKEFEEPGSWAELNNPYFFGEILNYQKNDIEFFYQIDAFKNFLDENKNVEEFRTADNKPFLRWPENLKKLFFKFVKNLWNLSDNYKLYLRDKLETKNWLTYSKNLSLNHLKNHVKNIKSKINTHIKNRQI